MKKKKRNDSHDSGFGALCRNGCRADQQEAYGPPGILFVLDLARRQASAAVDDEVHGHQAALNGATVYWSFPRCEGRRAAAQERGLASSFWAAASQLRAAAAAAAAAVW